MSDTTSGTTTTPAPATTEPDYRSSFPSMYPAAPSTPTPSMFDKPPGSPDLSRDDRRSDWIKAAFPSMAAEKAPPPPADTAEELKLKAAFPSMHAPAAPDAPTADAPGSEAPSAEGRTVTFRDVGDVNVPASLHLEPADLTALADAARELRLDAPATQRLINMHAQATANLTASADAAWSETVQGWRAAAQADPEVGGAAFTENVAAARAVLDRFATPALRKALSETGLGNHPELVRFVHRLGRALSEAEGKAADAAERFGRSLYGR